MPSHADFSRRVDDHVSSDGDESHAPPVVSIAGLTKLLSKEIRIQEEQLDTLEQLLLLAGERSSSLPDPHHMLEGIAAERLLASLMSAEKQHVGVMPMVLAEVDRIEMQLGVVDNNKGRQTGKANARGHTPIRMLCNELADFCQLQSSALTQLEEEQRGGGGGESGKPKGYCIQATMASKLFDVLLTKLELLKEVQQALVEAKTNAVTLPRPPPASASGATSTSSHPPPLATSLVAAAKDTVSNAIRNVAESHSSHPAGVVAFGALAATLAANALQRTTAASSDEHTRQQLHSKAKHSAGTAGREVSVASSDGSWKNEFHQAVLRSMMHSESPQSVIADAITKVATGGAPQRCLSEATQDTTWTDADVVSPSPMRGGSSSPHDAEEDNRRRRRRSRSHSTSSTSTEESDGDNISRSSSLSVKQRAVVEDPSALLPPSLAKEWLALNTDVEGFQAASMDLLSDATRIISDCDDAVLKLTQENEALRGELVRLGRMVDASRGVRDDAEIQSQALYQKTLKELLSSRGEVEHLTLELQQARERGLQANSERDAAMSRESALKDVVHAHEKEIHFLRSQEDLLRKEVKLMESKWYQERDRFALEKSEWQSTVERLRLRVKVLEEEAAGSFDLVERARREAEAAAIKAQRKQEEAKNVKVLFTKLEASHHDAKTEVKALKAAVAEKEAVLDRVLHVSRLKDAYSGTPHAPHGRGEVTSPANPGRTVAKESRREDRPNAFASPPRLPSPIGPPLNHHSRSEGMEDILMSSQRRGSTGKLVRMSPARHVVAAPAALQSISHGGHHSSTPVAPVGNADHPGAVTAMESTRQHSQQPPTTGNTNAQAYKVLANATQLLESINLQRKLKQHAPSVPAPSSSATEPSSTTHSLQAINGSEEGGSRPPPSTPNNMSPLQVLHELERREQELVQEAGSLAEQERSVLEKRSVVSSTLLAQRNQLLMKNAPDAEIEKLNNQISSIMERINQATSQIQTNKRAVEEKLSMLQEQRRGLLSGRH